MVLANITSATTQHQFLAFVSFPLLNVNTTSNSVNRRCVLLTNDQSVGN